MVNNEAIIYSYLNHKLMVDTKIKELKNNNTLILDIDEDKTILSKKDLYELVVMLNDRKMTLPNIIIETKDDTYICNVPEFMFTDLRRKEPRYKLETEVIVHPNNSTDIFSGTVFDVSDTGIGIILKNTNAFNYVNKQSFISIWNDEKMVCVEGICKYSQENTNTQIRIGFQVIKVSEEFLDLVTKAKVNDVQQTDD